MDVAAIKAPPGKGCPRCEGQVFHAEQMFSKGKTYHKKCFTCNTEGCKKPLDSVSACDAPDGEIYCKGMWFITNLNILEGKLLFSIENVKNLSFAPDLC